MNNDFWEKLTTPVPLYTEGNVSDTIAYIDARSGEMFNQLYKTALMYVQSQLTNLPFDNYRTNLRILNEAHQTAANQHGNAICARRFIDAVRWRYVMAALTDYKNALIAKERV